MTQTEALKIVLNAITQYLAESPEPSEEVAEGLCDAASAARKALAQPAQRKPLPYNKEDMQNLDVNQRLAFKLGWKSAEDTHGIKEHNV